MKLSIEIEVNESRRAKHADLTKLTSLQPSIAGDIMDRRFSMHSRIRSMCSGARIVGSALPVWTRSGDNIAIHKAIEIAQPGDVIVVDGQGDGSRALAGELMSLECKSKGILGLVVDGAIRDVSTFGEIGFPVFAVGSSPAGPYKSGPGSIGFPISCGGVVCEYGDIILADDTGVVVIPRRLVGKVIAESDAVIEKEAAMRAEFSRC